MPSYHAPLQDMRFVAHEVFAIEQTVLGLSAYQECDKETFDAILEEGAKLAQNLLQPLNQKGDEQGCQFDNGKVATPEGFKDAYKVYAESGWLSLCADPEYGGQGMPHVMRILIDEVLASANTSFSLYPALSFGTYHALHCYGSDELKQQYLPNLVSGQWTGVMCLTEPHSGTDLGLIRTKASPSENGKYKITGTKIFITGGDHDLTDNIVHMVLARLPDAPTGVKGISLFLIPKYKVNVDGSIGESNGVHCGSIEHKMGIKASSTCVMNYDAAEGYLVGEVNRGLQAMFTMMNLERINIGMQGLSLAEVAYQNAAHYAKERLQSRALTGAKYPDKAADPIIVHPDVRRMLLTMRAFNEGARALSVWLGIQIDLAAHSNDEQQRKKSDDLVALLTPVLKSFFTDIGFECCNYGMQIFGGHGYVKEWGMEQFVRDVRIAQIYEGANGVQALDLVKRKLLGSDGAMVETLLTEIKQFIASKAVSDEYSQPLADAVALLAKVSNWVTEAAQRDPNEIGAASTDYLHIMGLTVFAYMWCRMIAVAQNNQDKFYQNKLKTADFFMQRMLPRIYSLQQNIESGAAALMALEDAEF